MQDPITVQQSLVEQTAHIWPPRLDGIMEGNHTARHDPAVPRLEIFARLLVAVIGIEVEQPDWLPIPCPRCAEGIVDHNLYPILDAGASQILPELGEPAV